MMIKELKVELNYGNGEEKEETEEKEKTDKKEYDFSCVFCGSKRSFTYHKNKYICRECFIDLREGNYKKND